MTASIFLAKVMGLYLVIVYVSVLLNKKLMPALIKDVAKNTGFTMFGGAMALIVGLLVVLTHNVWSPDWIGLVTLLGWVILIKGVLMVLMPKKAPKWGMNISDNALTVSAIIMLLIGIYLTYVGFTA